MQSAEDETSLRLLRSGKHSSLEGSAFKSFDLSTQADQQFQSGSMPRVKNTRRDNTNSLVYFDVAISGGPTGTVDLGRVVFELYNDIAPKVYVHVSQKSRFLQLHLHLLVLRLCGDLQLQKGLDCRELPPAMYGRGRHRERHRAASSLPRLPIPQDHQGLHDSRWRFLQQEWHVSILHMVTENVDAVTYTCGWHPASSNSVRWILQATSAFATML